MNKPSGYLLHGTAFSSKEAAFEILVHNHEQELRFHKLWDEDAQPYYFAQPQLTIPQSIAEILGKYDEYNPTADRLIMMAYRDYQEFNDWIIKDWVKNDNIARAYLAGEVLGVDLVKVVEG